MISVAEARIRHNDDLRLLTAFPNYFLAASELLRRLITELTATPDGLVFGHVDPCLMDDLAAFGAEVEDFEPQGDSEAVA